MSGEDIPYQLRPNKFIDRKLFIELLGRVVSLRGAEKYIYASMGGRHLIDHLSIYRDLGIDAQYSFDLNENIVRRQMINRPSKKMHCEVLDASDFATKIDDIFTRFRRKSNLIVWLDYTSGDRTAQFQQAVEVMQKLNPGDIFRITLNAHHPTLCGGNEFKSEGFERPDVYRAVKLRRQLGAYMPVDCEEIDIDEVAPTLARCFGLAALAAERRSTNIKIVPALVTSYRDGMTMLTVTCVAAPLKGGENLINTFKKWKFYSRNWTDIHTIKAPQFSLKEQSIIDSKLHDSPKNMLRSLSFLPSDDLPSSIDALKSYRKFHRFHPTFRHVDK